MVDNFRLAEIPLGWYTVATSKEVMPGQVLPVKYFGQELILYRTETGEARLVDAYCPHMGAHLARGKVQGDTLRCSFHGFEFGGDGRCVRTGYGKAVPRKAKLGTWPIREHNGFVFAWYHPERTQPDWDIPVLPGPKEGWTNFRTRQISVKSRHPQETSENSVDVGHFVEVHGFGDSWYNGDLEVEGHLLKNAYGIDYLGGKLSLICNFKVEVHGLGYSLRGTRPGVLARSREHPALRRQLQLVDSIEPGRRGQRHPAHRSLREKLGPAPMDPLRPGGCLFRPQQGGRRGCANLGGEAVRRKADPRRGRRTDRGVPPLLQAVLRAASGHREATRRRSIGTGAFLVRLLHT
ncbi:MAG: Rieske 2Fe-2S domain-containing protein [Deltaproteobacteria bacterium]|nr:Rieske 2Fe-2S domain-containing protein [Deltaproteobacteria bacterium]